MSYLPKQVETLWTLFTAPVVWVLHFLTCYVVMAIFCAKVGGEHTLSLRLILLGITLCALGFIVLAAYLAWRQWGFGTDNPPHDRATREDRLLFQGFATLLLSGLSFVAVIFTALPLLFIRGMFPMRQGAFIAGLTVLLACWMLLILGMDPGSFTGHMLAHMGVVVVAAPLLAIGMSKTGFDVAQRWPWLSPLPASLLEFLIVWLWHAPLMRRLSETSAVTAMIEQALFLIGGIALWSSCFSAAPARRLSGVLALLLTSMHMTLLGVLLTMAPRALYGSGEVSCLGVRLDAAQDQQAGGVVMLMFGAVAYLCGGIALLAGYLRHPPLRPMEGR